MKQKETIDLDNLSYDSLTKDQRKSERSAIFGGDGKLPTIEQKQPEAVVATPKEVAKEVEKATESQKAKPVDVKQEIEKAEKES